MRRTPPHNLVDPHQHLGLARAVASSRRLSVTSVHDHDDSVQDAAVGLLHGLRTYKPERGDLVSHLRRRMHGEISDGCRRLDQVPRSLRRAERCAEEARTALEGELGRAPTEREVAERAGVGVQQLRRDLRPPASLDMEAGPAESTREPLVETIASPSETPEEATVARIGREELLSELTQLDAREQFVVRARWFLDCRQDELGPLLGVTRSRVAQIHTAALGKLRAALEE